MGRMVGTISRGVRAPIIREGDDLRKIVKQHRGDQCFTLFPSLLPDQGIEAADGIRFQSRHGTAAVQDKYDLCQILFH